MKFHYEFPIKKINQPLSHHHTILLIGSCFTENIGQLLKANHFNVLENPHGILFNPISVADAVEMYIDQEKMQDNQLFCLNETWHSWRHHSKFSGLTTQETIEHINASTLEAHQFLQNTHSIFITLGSAWVYELSELAINPDNRVVAANNHKAPANWFNKKLLSAAETKERLQQMLNKLFAFNAHLQVIFTISPVRHLREGVIENNRSKAVLIQAVHDLVNDADQLYYFPSYELVIDDLRDYRFYAEDLVHPNYHATKYVWEKLVESCFHPETQELMKQIQEINLAYQHKPFNPETELHKAFLKKYAKITTDLMDNHPELNLSVELTYFRTGLKH